MSVAIGAGIHVALTSAGAVLAHNDPRAVLSMMDLSRAGYLKMWQNTVWATATTSCLSRWRPVSWPSPGRAVPAAGAVLMPVCTIVVALNAQLLRRVKLNRSQVR